MMAVDRILFLDIDGVLAPFCRRNPEVLCAETCQRLADFIKHTDAKVVLVSSWPLEFAKEWLAEFGVQIHDAIDENDRCGGFGRYGLLAREAGIIDYVTAHRPKNYVWIDDWGVLIGPEKEGQEHVRWSKREHLPHPLADHYIKTDWSVNALNGEVDGSGFDENAFVRACHVLNVDPYGSTSIQIVEHLQPNGVTNPLVVEQAKEMVREGWRVDNYAKCTIIHDDVESPKCLNSEDFDAFVVASRCSPY